MRRPSPSMVVALIALFIALGGTSYAVIKLPKNSVGSREIRDRSVRSGDLAASAKPRRGPRGAQGPSGPAGASGPTSAPAEGWRTLTFTSGWSNYGGVWSPAQYRKDAAGRVYLRGLAKKTAAPAIDDAIAVLPAGYTPAVRQMFSTMMSTQTVAAAGRVDVLPSGEISWQGGPSAPEPNYTNLSDIIFWTE